MKLLLKTTWDNHRRPLAGRAFGEQSQVLKTMGNNHRRQLAGEAFC